MHKRIKEVRNTLRLNQQDFGENLGMTLDMIASLENKRVNIKDVTIRHICEIYHVDENWLRTGEGKMFSKEPKEYGKADEALLIFKRLRPEFQDFALKQMKQIAKLQSSIDGNNADCDKSGK